MRTDGYRRKIFLCYRAIFSPALDDSRNDSPFAENLDTRLKSVGPANYRHYTTSHGTRPCERYPGTVTFSLDYTIFIPIHSEKKSAEGGQR